MSRANYKEHFLRSKPKHKAHRVLNFPKTQATVYDQEEGNWFAGGIKWPLGGLNQLPRGQHVCASTPHGRKREEGTTYQILWSPRNFQGCSVPFRLNCNEVTVYSSMRVQKNQSISHIEEYTTIWVQRTSLLRFFSKLRILFFQKRNSDNFGMNRIDISLECIFKSNNSKPWSLKIWFRYVWVKIACQCFKTGLKKFTSYQDVLDPLIYFFFI